MTTGKTIVGLDGLCWKKVMSLVLNIPFRLEPIKTEEVSRKRKINIILNIHIWNLKNGTEELYTKAMETDMENRLTIWEGGEGKSNTWKLTLHKIDS